MIRETVVMDCMPKPDQPIPPIPIHVELRYDQADPAAVALAFCTGRQGLVTWVMGRDLLRQGLYGATGDGDVRVHQADDDDHVEIVLASPSGYARFRALRSDLEAFLDRTVELVPVGKETYDVDALLAHLLDTAS